MLTKFQNFYRLASSSDPRDRIQLDRKLEAQPQLGFLWKYWKRVKARLTQTTVRDYVKMQKRTYELFASADKITPGVIDGDFVAGSWRKHDAWPDYETYLMKYVPRDASWVAIEYGCGPGRNLRRFNTFFKRIDAVDISANNLANAKAFLQGVIPAEKMPNLYLTEGMNCGDAPKNFYDFAFSTICLQHICVHEVRFAIFRSLFETLKPGGRLSVQMGFGNPSPSTVPYHANRYAAVSTNRECDVEVADPSQIENDLKQIGFAGFEHWIRPVGPGDVHPNWIFFTAVKPGAVG
jgi:SAM-dependent methyltransferase